VREIASVLESGFEQVGVPKSLLGRPLFYPVKRRDVWRSEGLAESAATSAIGRVDRLTINDAGRVHSAVVSGESAPIVGDVFILAAVLRAASAIRMAGFSVLRIFSFATFRASSRRLCQYGPYNRCVGMHLGQMIN
jgi:hypothetical protein